MISKFLVTACLAGLAAAAPVCAETVHVSFDDVNLGTARGVAIVRMRIGWAADRVCGVGELAGIKAGREAQACRAAARTQGLAQLEQARARLQNGQRLVSFEVSTPQG